MTSLCKIFVKIRGGFGNQLFQLAKALEMQKQFGGEVFSIPAMYNPLNTQRPYLLNFHNTIIKRSNIEIIKFYSFFKPLGNIQTVKENQIFKYQEIFPKRNLICLDGYWQTYKSVDKIRPYLKEILFQNIKKNSQLMTYMSDIKSTNSVALHIRRGDYISNKHANKFHGLLPISYYTKAINLLNSKYKNLKLIFFSDDINWVKQNFSYNNVLYIDNISNKNKELIEIYLMSQCKHAIIANSSFSWWGAYLNENAYTNTTIAPKNWLNNEVSTSDLLLNHWIKI